MQEYGGDLGHGVLSRRAVSIESRRVKKKKKEHSLATEAVYR